MGERKRTGSRFHLVLRYPTLVIGLVLLALVVAVAATAGSLYARDPLALAGRPLQRPFENARFLLGTDSVGRNVAAQIFYGARTSLLVGLVATMVAIAVGIVVGAVAGFYGRWVDTVLMRVTEAAQTIPNFILLLVLVVIFGSKITTLAFVIGAVSWTAPARLTRAEFLTLRHRDFVQACKMAGMSDTTIIFREILPNALPPVIVYGSVVMALSILLESTLAFLGLSDPNVASWGNLIADGRRVLRTHAYVALLPGAAILVTVLSISLIGQGLNDIMNPRLRQR